MTRHAPTNTTRIRPRRRGFTIVELLVAVSLLALMLFLIDNLFNSTTRAVSDGVRQSAVLANARAVQSRLTIDASAMLGPNANNPAPEGGGYLIIINKEVQAVVKKRDGSEVVETFRVDQLVFMASTTVATSNIREFRGSAPRNANQFGSDFTSSYALIKYGHGLRVNRDGSVIGHAELGGTPAGSVTQWGRDAGLDRLANDWILARQAILFSPSDSTSNPLVAGDWYVDAPFWYETVQSSGGNELWQGQCDITILPPAGDAAGPTPGFVNLALDPNNTGLMASQITTNYLALTNTFRRQRVNPIPASNDFEPALIGQLHGVFAPNCSDFIVQFAADANNDGEIDRVNDQGTATTADDDNTGTEANGDPIFWYDMDSIDQLDGSYDGTVADLWGTTAWTGTTVPSPYENVSPSSATNPSANGQHAFIFRFEDDQAYTESTPGNGDVDNSKWPYMIRIRYRLHDAPGRLESNASFRLTDNKNNDPGNDGNIDEPDEAIVSGRYFEQIIRVPRP